MERPIILRTPLNSNEGEFISLSSESLVSTVSSNVFKGSSERGVHQRSSNKNNFNKLKSDELKLLQGLSDPKYSIWPPPALLPQVTFDDQHQGPEDQDALAAHLPHPADGLGPGQVREVIADPGPGGLTPVQLPLAETIHQLPPASVGRAQVQVRLWTSHFRIYIKVIFSKHIFKLKFFNVLRDHSIEKICSRVKYIDNIIRLYLTLDPVNTASVELGAVVRSDFSVRLPLFSLPRLCLLFLRPYFQL